MLPVIFDICLKVFAAGCEAFLSLIGNIQYYHLVYVLHINISVKNAFCVIYSTYKYYRYAL